MSCAGTDYLRLPVFTRDGSVHVVIEAPRGAQAKLKYEPGLRAFAFSRPLALGLVYPSTGVSSLPPSPKMAIRWTVL